MIKVLIADDQELIRESLKIVLGANEDMEVTGIAENGEEVLSQIRMYPPCKGKISEYLYYCSYNIR